jgi:response regulator RpfG family c-di-GMP phosphodiesterase
VFDALTTTRPYKPAFSADEAYAELRHEVQKGWRRRDLVEEFVQSDRTGRMQGLIVDLAVAVPMHEALVVAHGC